MNVRLVAVGKLKEKYFQQAVAEYAKRISRYAKFDIIEVAECFYDGIPSLATIDNILDKEATAIADKLVGYVIVLDIYGRSYDSLQFSNLLKQAKQNNSAFTFVIGGSYGLSDKIKSKADLLLSLGQLTLPHQLARVVMAEQIYRVMTIHNNITYHK